MRNTIRCCISCILPCGALDVIRIVHVNGRVEEITGTIYAAEVLKAHPKHILKKPTTKPISDDIEPSPAHHRPAIVVVPPDAQLQRGKIYFLIPVIDGGKKNRKSSSGKSSSQSVAAPDSAASTARRRKKEQHKMGRNGNNNNNNERSNSSNNNCVISLSNKDDDKYLSEILSENVSSQREKRRGRVAVWRPHLESITETISEAASTVSDQY